MIDYFLFGFAYGLIGLIVAVITRYVNPSSAQEADVLIVLFWPGALLLFAIVGTVNGTTWVVNAIVRRLRGYR